MSLPAQERARRLVHHHGQHPGDPLGRDQTDEAEGGRGKAAGGRGVLDACLTSKESHMSAARRGRRHAVEEAEAFKGRQGRKRKPRTAPLYITAVSQPWGRLCTINTVVAARYAPMPSREACSSRLRERRSRRAPQGRAGATSPRHKTEARR